MEIEALSAWLLSEAEQPRIQQLPVLKRGGRRERGCAVRGEEKRLASGEGPALAIAQGCDSLHTGLGGDPMEGFFPFPSSCSSSSARHSLVNPGGFGCARCRCQNAAIRGATPAPDGCKG